MLTSDIEEAAGVLLSSTISNPRRPSVVVKAPLIVGFDTEYRPEDRSLLSVQLAARSAHGVLESRVYYPDRPKLSVDEFGSILGKFMGDVAPEPRPHRRVHLVAHFAQAELGGFEDPLRDWNIRQFGKAHQASMDLLGPDGLPWSIRLVDLFGYFPTSLRRIGESVGLEKIDVDATTLEQLLRSDRPSFEAYGKRDAEMVLVALERFRHKMLSEWGIDVLGCGTIASVASEIFRRRYLSTHPGPVKWMDVVERRRGPQGYKQVPRRVLKYDGSSDIRLMACRSYWGGRTEAFVRGLHVGPVVMRDVISLYPHAALLQPLPTEKTRWEKIERLDDVIQTEGFGHFEFEFPVGTMYPCLPVVRDGVRRLTFPRKGESYCTFSEVRAALAMGASVAPVRVWGFHPTPQERDHDIGRYMRTFIEKKNAEKKGLLEYETAKYLLNALIGKLGERRRGSAVVPFERDARVRGLPGVVGLFARTPATRAAFRHAPATGSAWAPEWSTLILGRARALMAPMVARGALVVSTDAVLVPADVSLDTDALSELECAGSGMTDEAVGDAAFVARSRLYAVLRKPENLTPDQVVLARDKNWVVVKVARHGSPETKEQFAQTVLGCLAAGADVTRLVAKERLLGAHQAILSDKELNASVTEQRQTHLRWDGKRVLRNRDVNPFTSVTGTDPYLTLGKLEAAEHQRRLRGGAARRRRDAHAPATMDKVLAMLEGGASARAVAAETGVAKSTVQDIKKRFSLAEESDH